MENAGYLFAAYTIIWAVIFGFILFIQRKQKKLQQQIDLLRKAANKTKTDD